MAISRGEGCCIEIEKNLHDRNDSWETGDDPNSPRRKCNFPDRCSVGPPESIGITKNYTHTRMSAGLAGRTISLRTFVYG